MQAHETASLHHPPQHPHTHTQPRGTVVLKLKDTTLIMLQAELNDQQTPQEVQLSRAAASDLAGSLSGAREMDANYRDRLWE